MSRKVTLTGHFTLLDDTPAVGAALIRPSRSPILDLDGKQVIAGPQRFTLDEEGRFSANLPPTDDPALGENFTYDVMVTMHHTNWQVTGLTLPSDMISVDVLDPPAGVVKEYPTRAEWGALTEVAVAEMETALDGAETARDQSLEARDTTVVARDETLTARDVTLTARDTAVGAASETETARTETLTARDATFTARSETTTALSGAESARDTAVGAATEAVATLAGKVTGTGMSVRVDNSVGTRVLLDHPGGTTMLYGDTGWRTITSWDETGAVTGFPLRSESWEPTPGTTGGIFVRRVLDTLRIVVSGLTRTSTTSAAMFDNRLPVGFRPQRAEILIGLISTTEFATLGLRTNGSLGRNSSSLSGPNGDINITAEVEAETTWPDALPGTPGTPL